MEVSACYQISHAASKEEKVRIYSDKFIKEAAFEKTGYPTGLTNVCKLSKRMNGGGKSL